MSDAPDRPGDEPGPTQTGEVTCPACDGTGQVADEPCATCGGTGLVRQIVGDA